MAKRGKIKEQVRDVLERPHSKRHYKEYFLLVCEDESTEPCYFEKVFQEEFEKLLPKDTIRVEPVGTGRNSLGVVERAISIINTRTEPISKEIDHVWVIFDKDDLDNNDSNRNRFVEAFNTARENNIHVAYSNECFELWLLLHFVDIDGNSPIPRNITESEGYGVCLYGMLQKAINAHLPKHKQILYSHKHHNKPYLSVSDLIKLIIQFGDEEKAIERAKRLDKLHKNVNPIDANPNTTVYKLVQELREWLQYYQY